MGGGPGVLAADCPLRLGVPGLRRQMTESDPELEAHVHGSDLPIERTLAARIAEDLGLPTDALAPRLAGAAVVTSMGTVTEPVSRGERRAPRLRREDPRPRRPHPSASRGPSSARGPSRATEACWSTVRQPGPNRGLISA